MSTEVTEQNKVIAEFMGKETEMFNGKLLIKTIDEKGRHVASHGKLYDEDWNQLMAVVEKIESITTHDGRGEVNYIVTIEEKYCVISVGGEETVAEYQDSEATKVEIVHHAVYDFIVKYQSIKHL